MTTKQNKPTDEYNIKLANHNQTDKQGYSKLLDKQGYSKLLDKQGYSKLLDSKPITKHNMILNRYKQILLFNAILNQSHYLIKLSIYYKNGLYYKPKLILNTQLNNYLRRSQI